MSWLDGIEERVVAAYRQHGLRATPHEFVGEGACCAVGALCFGLLNVETWNQAKVAARHLDAPPDDLWSFVYGFDAGCEGIPEQKISEARTAGYRTAEAVKAAGLLVDERLGE
jgi:hypothetical protein